MQPIAEEIAAAEVESPVTSPEERNLIVAKRYFMFEVERKRTSTVMVALDTDSTEPLEDRIAIPSDSWNEYFGTEAGEWEITDVTEIMPERLDDSDRRDALPGMIEAKVEESE